MSKITRKTIVIFLILNLICASINPAIFGLISHAEEGEGGVVTDTTTLTNIELGNIGEQLGIDKTEWSTTQVNDVNFTITMDTDQKGYSAPCFYIRLPQEVEDVEIIKSLSLPNSENFIINSRVITVNEQKAIYVSLEGRIPIANEKMQVIINTKIKVNSLIPTKIGEINFKFDNGNGDVQEATTKINMVAKEGVIVGVIATDEEGSVIAANREEKTMQTTANEISLTGIIINNTQKEIKVQVKVNYKIENIESIENIEDIGDNILDIKIEAGGERYINGTAEVAEIYNPLDTGKGLHVNYRKENEALVSNFAYVKCEKIREIEANIENEKISASINLSDLSDNNLYLGENLEGTITIKNKSDINMDFVLYVEIPEEVVTNESSFRKKVIEDGREIIEIIEFTEGEKIKLNTINVPAGETITILTSFEYVEYVVHQEEEPEPSKIEVALVYGEGKQNFEGIVYIASEEITFNPPSDVEVKIKSDKESAENLNVDEDIEYTVSIKNNAENPVRVNVELLGIGNLKIYSIKLVDKDGSLLKQLIAPSLDGKFERIDVPKQTTISNEEEKIPGEVKLIVSAKVKEKPENGNIAVSAKVTGKQINSVTTKTITNTINGFTSNAKASIVSGTAWIDENGNGAIDNKEALLKDVQAVLVNSTTAEIVGTARTDNNGQYEFTEIEEGNYVVNFNYNAKTFKTTSYKNETAAEEANSDAITTVQNNTATTKTDIIKISNGTEENANIGLVLNRTFDMAINSGINKVTVDNEQGSNTYDFNNINLAKVEIEGEYFKDSLVLVEYEVAVTNLNEVEGYATKISSKVPDGMEFIAELNPDWYEGENGKIYSSALANEKLAQGETKTIKLVLAREMTEGIIQSPVNIVEIEETFNDYLIKDNKTENDKSEATIIISLTTGNVQKYLWLAVLVIAIITVGLFGTRKIVKTDINNLTKKGKE